MLFILKLINDFFCWLGNNLFIIGVSSVVTIIGFFITLSISIKTKGISKKIAEFRTTKEYNIHRLKFKESLLAFREAIIKDDVDIRKIKGNILDELNAIRENFIVEFDIKQRIVIRVLIIHIERKDKHNKNFICNQLSRIASYFNMNKEEVI